MQQAPRPANGQKDFEGPNASILQHVGVASPDAAWDDPLLRELGAGWLLKWDYSASVGSTFRAHSANPSPTRAPPSN
jgi:hypothetical protein